LQEGSNGKAMMVARAGLVGVLLMTAESSPRGGAHAVQATRAQVEPVAVIQAYENGLAGVRAANPEVRLSVGRDPAIANQPVLVVEYPAATGDPAGRDVQCTAETRDWTGGRAISFQIKPERAMKLSVSFMDRNRVAYTAWTGLQGGVWQLVRIPFSEIRPNPFFQFPGAKTGAPLDVSDVGFIAFAPQDEAAGRLAIGRFVISRQD
jgi:hypothetical protein